MKQLVRILIVEDESNDAALAKIEIQKTLNDCEFQVVKTREGFVEALKTFQPDVILSDYALPYFDGMKALELTLQHAPLTPLIIWTGSISEDVAVDCVKAGANNYILKDNLKRLGPAILRALEEKELLAARKQAEESYHSIFENSVEGIFQSSPEGQFINLNPAMAHLYGYDSPEEMIASIHDIARQMYVEPDQRSEFMRLVDANESVEHFETRNFRKDGNIIWIAISARAVRDPYGNVQYYEGSVQDITQRKRAEAALQNNEKRFRVLIESGLDDISLLAADGTLLWESPSIIRNLGYAPNEYVGRNIFELMHPEDLEWTQDTFVKLIQEPGTRRHGTFRLRRVDGTWRWVEAIATNMLSEPAVNAIVINYRDVTERKQAEIELQQRNVDLALVNALNEVINQGADLDTIVDLLREELKRNFSAEYTNMYLLDPEGQTIKMQGYALPPAVEKKIEKVIGRAIPPIEIPVQKDGAFQNVMRSGHGVVISDPETVQKWLGEFVETASLSPVAKAAIRKLLTQISKILNIKSTILVPLISDAQALGVLNVSGPTVFTEQDLKRIEHICGQLTTALRRKQVEEKLRRSENQYRLATKATNDVIWEWDAKTHQLLWSENAWYVFGYPEAEIGLDEKWWDDHLHPDDRAHVLGKLDALISGHDSIWLEEYRFRLKDGSYAHISDRGYLERDETGQAIRMIGAMSDITSRKEAELERLALLEIMQGFAHTRDLQELLELIHGSIANVIYAENFFVVLYHEKSGLFEEIYSVDQYDLPEPPSKLEKSITSYVFHSGEPLLLTQTSFEELAAEGQVQLVGTDSASWLGVPLKTSGRTIGVMAVQDYENDNRYSDHDKDFLSSIATQVALLIEHRRAGEALRESEEHYRTIFEGVQDAIFVESLDGRILMVNERACEMFGYSQAEFLTKTVADLVPPGHLVLTADEVEAPLSAEPHETINQRANGEVFPIEISGRVQVINGERVLLVVVRDITERKQAETALRESVAQFRTLFEASPDAIILIDQRDNWPILDCNTAACQMNGYTREELIGQSIDILNVEPSSPEGRAEYLERIRNAGVLRVEAFHRRKDGSLFPVDTSTSLITIGNREVVLGIDRDVSERKAAEEELKRSTSLLHATLESTADGILVVEADSRISNFNRKFLELWSVPYDLAAQQDDRILLEFVLGQLKEPSAFLSKVEALYRSPEATSFDELEFHDGRIFERYSQPQRLGNAVVGRVWSFRDITERKQAEDRLRESEERFSSAFEYASIGMALVALDGRWSRVNWALCWLLGYSEEELLQKTFQDITHPGDLENDLAYVRQLLAGEINSYQMEKRYFHKQGHVVWGLLSVSLVKDNQGKPQYFISQIQDITERKRVEESLQAERRKAEKYLETAGVMMLALDRQGTVTMINHKGCEILGYPADEIIGKNWMDTFLPEATRAELQGVFQRLISGHIEGPEYYENPILTRHGEERLIAWHNTLLRDEQGRIISSLSSGEDVTERKRAEEQIRRRAEETAALLQTSLALTSLDLEATLQTVGSSANKLFLADGCRIFLLEPGGETLRCVLALGENTNAFLDLRVKIGQGVTGAVAASGRAEIVNEMQTDPRAVQVAGTEEEQEAIMFAPLKERDRVIGILSIRRVGGERGFQDGDLELLEAFASMTASAVSNARLFEETQRRLAELNASEERFRQLADNIQEVFWMTDAETGQELYMSPAVETIWGRPIQCMMYEPDAWISSVYSDDRPVLLDAFEKEKNGEKVQFEYRIVRPDGSLRWIWDRAFPIYDNTGRVKTIAGISADITERKQHDQQLRKLSSAVGHSGSTIIITDTTGNIEYVNRKFTQITGYTFEEVIGKNPRILKSGFTSQEEYQQLWQTISRGREWHGELLNKKKDGTLFWESVTISPILNDRREITHYVGVKEDITERKQTEIETRRHIAELEAVYENGLSVGRLLEPREIGNRVIETFSLYLSWHHVTIRLTKEGCDELELVAFSLPDLREEERAEVEQHYVGSINKVGQGLSGWVIETGAPLRTGDVHAHPQYVDMHAEIQSGLYMPLKVGDRIIGVISVESEAPDAFTEQDQRLLATLANQTAIAFENARLYEAMQKELSERKRVEEALRISETHYRALADSITDILFELDQNLCYIHWNKASETLIGVPAQDAIGKSLGEVLGKTEEQARIKTVFENVLKTHQSRTFETNMVIAGENRSFEVNAYPSMRGVSVVAKDVTDRKRTETIMQKRFELMEYSARHSLKELMQRTVDEVSELTGSTIGFFHFMAEDQIHLGMQTWSTDALQLFQVSAEEGAHHPVDQAGVWADAVRLRRPLIQNDYESLTRKKGTPQGHVPIVREMIIPIIRNERIMAVMGIGNKTQDYTSHDLGVAARLADYAWDVTERKLMEIALEVERNQLVQRVEERTADLSRANSNLARALRVKDEFLANMSHELRTPLNAILGLSESLGEQIAGPLNEKQQKYISTISESGHHLLSLINDILDLAKIDAGQITLDINKVDIHSVCQASLRMIKQLAQKKNQDVSLQIDTSLGLMWADERRLKQMIVNLLGNAVKFTPENGRLGLEVHGDEDANQIAITVWDNGIGIKQEDLARLFQPFVQLDSGLAREATGTGLGLALVAQMARLHGGGVNAVSDAGKGSRFTITLPWEPALAIDTASRMKITGKFRALKFDEENKPSILLVEDTKEVVMMLKDYLELAGYRVFTAQDGIDGIVQARHVKPDLILMDVQMPRMDGFETTRKLRSDPNFRYTPIIALTALAMPHDRERCLEAGMDEYISKPINLKALIKIIQGCLFEQGSRTP